MHDALKRLSDMVTSSFDEAKIMRSKLEWLLFERRVFMVRILSILFPTPCKMAGHIRL